MKTETSSARLAKRTTNWIVNYSGQNLISYLG